MRELYYWNGGKEGYVWAEILQSCHKLIHAKNRSIYWYNRTPDKEAYIPQKINDFFSKWRHNPNDGGYWTDGAYDRIFVGYDPDTKEKVYINGGWNNPEWKIKDGGTYLTDSYGRIIPSGYVKACYLRFKPAPVIAKRCSSYWRYSRGKGTGNRNGHWRKNKNWHAGRCAKKRAWYGHYADSKEIFKEYGLTYKMDDKEFHSNYHNGNKGKTWKRTKVRKQYMRNLK